MKRTSFASIYAAIFILLTTVAFAQVAISPSNPQDSDDLTCSGLNPSSYIYKWYLDSQEKASGTILSNSQTSPNQVWTCKVYNPPTRYTGITQKGEASVTIQSNLIIPQSNDPPIITSTPVTTAVLGILYTYDLDATDSDGDTLTYSLISSPAGMTISPTTGVVSWTPGVTGIYPVSTGVTDGQASVVQNFSITVTNQVPMVNFTSDAPKVEGSSVSFTDSSTDSDGTITSRFWDFGDGANSITTNPTHAYASNGDYLVNLTVTDNGGLKNSVVRTVSVTDSAPSANFNASTTIAFVNEQINFTSLSTYYYDPIVTWRWAFTGSFNSGPPNTTYAYTTSGTKYVYHRVIDSDGSWNDVGPLVITIVDPVFHNISLSITYINSINGIRITNSTGSDLTSDPANLIKGQNYTIRYRTDNIGNVAENYTDTIRIYNSTGAIVFTNTHTHTNRPVGSQIVDTDTWNTASLNQGTYTITVNASVTGYNDGSSSDNYRTRTVNLIVPADTIPPAAITGLYSSNQTNTTITWSWANPVDVDFAGTAVFIDGLNAINLTNTDTGYTATGLLPNTTHSIIIYTRDLAGNINITGVSNTNRTRANPAPDTAAPTWIETPTNGVVQAGSNLNYDLNATDNVAVDDYSINDSRFSIDKETGLLQNTIPFYAIKTYYLKLKVNDTANNILTTDISITVNGIPNLYGTVRDTNTGAVIPGANLSFYSNATCSLDEINLNENGNCALNPKAIPDAVTDVYGNYSVYLPSDVYQMIVQHSRQADRNLFVNNTPKKHDTELKEGLGGINFEGHILYGGRYRDGNKYIMGDLMTFVMFGVNNAAQNATVTYLVERHVAGVDNGANGPWVLNGSFSDSSKTLTVPANGNKVSKIFNFIIPPKLSMPGRYDIHVLVNNSGTMEKWHKIGNFFIEEINLTNPRLPPELKLVQGPEFYDLTDGNINKGQYVNGTFNASFRVQIKPQPSTINGILLFISVISHDPCIVANEGDEVTILAPGAQINFSGTTTNNIKKINVTNARTTSGCYITSDFKYSVSDKFKINVSVKERYYGALSPIKQVNVTIWATEQQARDIYFDIIEQTIDRAGYSVPPYNTKPINFTGFYAGDRNPLVGAGGYGAFNQFDVIKTRSSPRYYYIKTDVFDTEWGFEYRSDVDGKDNGVLVYPAGSPAPCQSDVNVSLFGATACERDSANADWYAVNTPYILVTDPMTRKDLAQRIMQFGDYMVSQGQSP